MKKTLAFFLLFSLFIGCSSTKRSAQNTMLNTLKSTFYNHQFSGLLVVNSQNNDTLLNFNSEKYFTPASNTKIFTLFAALELLSDSIPALKHITLNDTLFIEGTGDPTFVHSNFSNQKTLNFLKAHNNIALNLNNFQEEKLGTGWAWDDYHYYYQPEMSSFPMYGNVATLSNASEQKIIPFYFKDSIISKDYHLNRVLEKNKFYLSPLNNDTIEVPFRTSQKLTKNLLEQRLNKKIILVNKMPAGNKKITYSIDTDTVLKRMMLNSDNFLAEQLLLLCSSTLSDTLSGKFTRNYILKNKLANLNQPPRWVDGSGLSRYNLFTPASIVAVLSKMHAKIPEEQLFEYFPTGGVSGSLKNWYAGNPTPYIYAKTGSLGNNHNLSGYLITNSGKTLIFSFMNNHFRHPSSEVKKNMQLLLEQIRDTY